MANIKISTKGIANQLSNALLAPLAKTHPDTADSWIVAHAVLKALHGFVNKTSTFSSSLVPGARLNVQAMYEVSKKDALPQFFGNTGDLVNELKKDLPSAIEESINSGFISFNETNPDDKSEID